MPTVAKSCIPASKDIFSCLLTGDIVFKFVLANSNTIRESCKGFINLSRSHEIILRGLYRYLMKHISPSTPAEIYLLSNIDYVPDVLDLQVPDETRDNTHRRKVQGGQVRILWQDGDFF